MVYVLNALITMVAILVTIHSKLKMQNAMHAQVDFNSTSVNLMLVVV